MDNFLFKNTSSAFDAFYDNTVGIMSKDTMRRQQLKCCICSCMSDDITVSDEMSLDSNRASIELTFRRCDWDFVSKLSRGDFIYVDWDIKGKKFVVSSSKFDPLFGWIITAREV